MIRFKIILKPEETFGLTIVHAMANYLPIPQAGAVTKGVYLKKKHHLGYGPFLASVFYCFVFSLTATGLMACIGLAVSSKAVPWLFWSLLLVLPLTPLMLVPAIWKLPLLRTLNRFSGGLELLWDLRLSGLVLLQNTLITLLLALGLSLSFLSFEQPIHWVAALLLAVGPILAGIVKLTPGNLGLVESLAWMTAVMIGVSAEQTVAALAIYRITALFFCFSLGPYFANQLWKDAKQISIATEETRLKSAA